MVYLARRVDVDNMGEIINKRKRRETFVTPAMYRVGTLAFLRPGKLYRVEEDITPPAVQELAERQEGGFCRGTKKKNQG